MIRLVLLAAAVLMVPAAPTVHVDTAPSVRADTAPTVRVEPAEAGLGERVTVRLAGWADGNVLVELCGNDAGRGAADCAVAASAQTYVGTDGEAVVPLPVVAPPVACPCVVRARDPAGTLVATAPLVVAGLEADPAPEPPAAGALVVTDLAVTGGRSWPELFGGPAPRTVRVTVANTGEASLVDPPLTLLLGRGDHPTTLVAGPELGTIPAGGQQTYQLPVTLPAPAVGRYTVRGEVGGAAFLAETSSHPWGLTTALALLVVLAAAGTVRTVRLRSR